MEELDCTKNKRVIVGNGIKTPSDVTFLYRKESLLFEIEKSL